LHWHVFVSFRAGTVWKILQRSGWLKNATGPLRPVNGPVGIICSTGEIPAKTGEKVTNFLENNF
jgi:hypothetical protein